MERVSQPFVGPYCWRHGRGDMTLVEPSNPPRVHFEFVVESRVGRHLLLLAGSEVKEMSYLALLELYY